MGSYYVNRTPQANGDHEVHELGCPWLALLPSTQYLGEFINCHGAVAEAKKIYRAVNGCKYCAEACHTS